MSFSSIVKNELCHLVFNSRCCLNAEFASILRANPSISVLDSEQATIRISTENAAFARRIFSLMKKLYGIIPEITVRKNTRLLKHSVYIIVHSRINITKQILMQSGIIDSKGRKAGPGKLEPCCMKAYLRGAFLSGGAISDPEKTYHLEITFHTREEASHVRDLMNHFGLGARIIKRKSSYITYVKEGEHIADFINIIGAHKSLMELENIRILKEMRNNVNRVVNCETANLEKTVNAAYRQIENIEYIKENFGFDNLPPLLEEIAELRLKFQDATMKELGEMLQHPIGKSGVNHRLRKLDEMVDKIRETHTNNL